MRLASTSGLMAGSGHGQGGWRRIDWIEVYGNPVRK